MNVQNKLECFFAPAKYFEPSPMFASKARSLPKSGSYERFSTRVGSGLTCKQHTSLKRSGKDKRSNLL
jgi:hypothetical protein